MAGKKKFVKTPKGSTIVVEDRGKMEVHRKPRGNEGPGSLLDKAKDAFREGSLRNIKRNK